MTALRAKISSWSLDYYYYYEPESLVLQQKYPPKKCFWKQRDTARYRFRIREVSTLKHTLQTSFKLMSKNLVPGRKISTIHSLDY